MKSSKSNIIITVAIIIFTFSHLAVSGQGVDIRANTRQQELFIGLSLYPAQTFINNSGTKLLSELVNSKKTSFSGAFELGINLHNNIGLSTGIGYSSYSAELSLDSYIDSVVNQIDQDQDLYIRRISGTNISETQKIGMIIIPLAVNFQLPVNELFGLYLQTGINVSFTVSKKFSSSGTMTYSGYYPAYKIVITGVNHEGFVENSSSLQEGILKVSAIIPEFSSSGGINLTLGKNTQILFGLYYNRLLSTISGYSSTDEFHLSTNLNEMNSMMAGYQKGDCSGGWFETWSSVQYQIIIYKLNPRNNNSSLV